MTLQVQGQPSSRVHTARWDVSSAWIWMGMIARVPLTCDREALTYVHLSTTTRLA
jgi:hypothetical protein